VRKLRGRLSDALNYPQGRVGELAFSHDGTRLATGFRRPGLLDLGYGRVVKVWDLASGRELRTLTSLENTVPMLAFTPGGRTLATGVETSGLTRLRDTADGRAIRDLAGSASGWWICPSRPTSGRRPPRTETGRSNSGTW
jgi:WD40 repeat protein